MLSVAVHDDMPSMSRKVWQEPVIPRSSRRGSVGGFLRGGAARRIVPFGILTHATNSIGRPRTTIRREQ